ncbi:hypothetical protein PENANT_c002G06747 [Penicillium antarcticum]|uniref:Uncharacterized protein n=1 Tax=Penicillium antarcticum TaxID=416450 RepID=A0A1V6QJS8_9EURO|nr:uncharacterized protein N7508_006661 [Penicillium antarcticum]KAJ5301798.1 hypothetical protein N7508_006661 [Penicillium antarcticum]OQD89470.1 hypothetical protein PENANT_c002G06747 [Penicillium antarcticum]
MRSGLDKAGALPLLALIVFSLLTLVPSMSSIYNIKFADFSFFAGTSRQVPLIQDGSAEIHPKAHPLNDPTKPWRLAGPHRSRVNLQSRTSRIGGAAAIPASETTAVANKSRIPSIARESSFSFTRRARAFRTYFIQQLDDYPFLVPFSNRSLAASTDAYPTITLDESTLPTPDIDHTSMTSSSNHSSHDIHETGLQFLESFQTVCQQACHTAIDFGKRLALFGAEYAKSIFLTDEQKDVQTTLIRHPTPHPTQEEDQLLQVPAPAQQKIGAEEATDAAAGRHSQELHGSCMAVVIGLVAGIMWF